MTRRLRQFALALLATSTLAAPVLAEGSLDGADEMSRPYGAQPGDDTRPMTVTSRDANGNRVIVNGRAQASAYASASGAGYRRTGVGGTATAIGNQLNVVVQGSWNTVIVDAQQINNGDVSANVSLNGGLDLD